MRNYMKRMLLFIIIILVAFISLSFVHATSDYISQEAGITITIPSDWVELDLAKERQIVKTEGHQIYKLSDGSIFSVGWIDVWEEMGGTSSGYERKSINNDSIQEEYKIDLFRQMGNNSKYSGEQTINGVEYIKGIVKIPTVEINGNTGYMNTITYCHFRNGFMYVFQYGPYQNDSISNQKIVSVISSAEYSFKSDQEGNIGFGSVYSNKFIILANIFITITIYSFPIIIYRYAIKKAPIEPRRAKKISIIYAIIALLIIIILADILKLPDTVLGSGTLGLGGFINYKMLTSGKNTSQNASNNSAVYYANPVIQNDTIYCVQCGKVIPRSSNFCRHCGRSLS